jgi:hypothetical protein
MTRQAETNFWDDVHDFVGLLAIVIVVGGLTAAVSAIVGIGWLARGGQS